MIGEGLEDLKYQTYEGWELSQPKSPEGHHHEGEDFHGVLEVRSHLGEVVFGDMVDIL